MEANIYNVYDEKTMNVRFLRENNIRKYKIIILRAMRTFDCFGSWQGVNGRMIFCFYFKHYCLNVFVSKN